MKFIIALQHGRTFRSNQCICFSDTLVVKQQTCIPGGTNTVLILICFTSNSLLDDSQKGPKSHLEILAEMRDYKRRRQSYRAKNVHITKKSYTEVSSSRERCELKCFSLPGIQ